MQNKALLPGAALLAALSGCVSETSYVGAGPQPRDAVFTASDAAVTRMNLGLEYLRRGDVEQAKFNLDKALFQDPGNPDIHLAKAWFYQSVSEFDNAEKSYRKLLKLSPNHGDGLNNYGVFLCARERFDEADVMFRKAVVVPGYVQVADTYENAALCAMQAGRQEQALGYYQRALEYNPAKSRSLLGAAEILVIQGDNVVAREYINRYQAEHQPSPQSLWLTVRTAEELGMIAQAQQAGADLVRLFPGSEQAKRFLANDY
ncbi:type IV pilus biogenesis/stability protein PilW [Zobellella maritima]|uniref:type IV pilus biogenesis/stability protein PilW n=1 Tax=Zobellella maritima TaxID=2059725 RepID=UPI0018E560E0|nr:type IV pilus biogenesis/stability protein PilW [Zobellella maritima]